MKESMDIKWVNANPPEAIHDNTSVTAVAVDALGFNEATFVISLGATDIAVTALKLTECATSGGSYSDVSGASFTGSNLPSATDDNGIWLIHVNLKNPSRLRYYKVVITFGDGASGGYATCIAALGQGGLVPYDATTRGAVKIVSV